MTINEMKNTCSIPLKPSIIYNANDTIFTYARSSIPFFNVRFFINPCFRLRKLYLFWRRRGIQTHSLYIIYYSSILPVIGCVIFFAYLYNDIFIILKNKDRLLTMGALA